LIAATVERTATIVQPIISYDFTTALPSIKRTRVSLRTLKFAATVVATIGAQLLVMAVIFHYRGAFSELGAMAYPGIVLAEFGNSAMILLPTPWPAYTLAMSVILNPWLVGIIGGLAAATGEMVGYYLGCKGRSMVGEGRIYARMQSMTARYGDGAIFFFAVMPVPFDIAGIWAGTVRYPIVRFFLSVAAAKIIRITLVGSVANCRHHKTRDKIAQELVGFRLRDRTDRR
jgi:membrane protein YqaA with SNARE-associated domain